mmetsp:Transcript_18109/g.25521  ORF Transcript_18109/g.25521 Transcript_18109/m.25521 type:complete len:523 (-) Transcript_18109:59-1627(-)
MSATNPQQQQQHAGNASTATSVEVMDLTADSVLERQKHEALLIELEAKKRAVTVDVPTLPNQVRDGLRQLGLPVRIFGENLANVRSRLQMELAKIEVLKEKGLGLTTETIQLAAVGKAAASGQEVEDQVTKYTRASSELVEARDAIAKFSMKQARNRLVKEQRRRLGSRLMHQTVPSSSSTVNPAGNDNGGMSEVERLDNECTKLFKSLGNMTLEGSQYGGPRPLSAVCTSGTMIATAGWDGAVKLWDGSSPQLDLLGSKSMGHEDRITGIAMQQNMIATSSIDLSGKLWKISDKNNTMDDDDDDLTEDQKYTMEEVAHLKGHQARLCSVAFHPMGKHVGTTSFDHTWRLWDIESGGSQLLLQDGHWKETYGIGFHSDGSLVSTTDFGGIVHVWDLRTGKSVCHFLGHAKRVLCSEFSPNGFHLASAGDDGTIKIWDLRKRKHFASLPAHSNLISQIRFDREEGEFLTSSSFDGTVKLWSTRDWKMLSSLRGHEGKVMGVDVLGGSNGIVTSGYDKTLKIWK